MHWLDLLDERQRKAVAFAEHYATTFSHGATGHNDLLLIHRLAGLLEYATTHAGELPSPTPREDLPLGFGKYAQETLRQVATHDRGYVSWLFENSRDSEIQQAAERIITEWATSGRGPGNMEAKELPF